MVTLMQLLMTIGDFLNALMEDMGPGCTMSVTEFLMEMRVGDSARRLLTSGHLTSSRT